MKSKYRVRPWSREEEDKFRSMIAAGRSPADVAVELHRSVSAVQARAHLLRLSFRLARAKIAKSREIEER